MRNQNDRPKARTKSLVIKELADETLVYDLDADKAHCLNRSAALVWKYCDGRKTTTEIRQAIEKETNSPMDERLIRLGVNQLHESNLLDSASSFNSSMLNRRRLIRQIGVAAIAIPAVLSIAVPPAMAQASPCQSPGNRPDGCPCGNAGDCLPGHHCNGGICGP